MKQKRKGYKKFIFGGIAFVLVIGIISADLFNNAAVAQAKQNTFHGMAPYQTTPKNGLSILEITPTVNDKDFGYFVHNPNPKPNDDQIAEVSELTQGTLLRPYSDSPDLQAKLQRFRQLKADAESEAGAEAREAALNDPGLRQKYEDYKAQAPWYNATFEEWCQVTGYYGPGQNEYNAVYQQKFNALVAEKISEKCAEEGIDYNEMAIVENADMYYAVNLRRYGMIKYEGRDSAIANGDFKRNALSEYPIFNETHYALFDPGDIEGGYTLVTGPTGNMASGYYELNKDNTGAYQLREGYVLGDGSWPTDAVDTLGKPENIQLRQGYIYKRELYVDHDNGAGDEPDSGAEDGTDTEDDAGADDGEPGADSGVTGVEGEVQQDGALEEPLSEEAVSVPSDVQPETVNPESTVENTGKAADASGDITDNETSAAAASANGAAVIGDEASIDGTGNDETGDDNPDDSGDGNEESEKPEYIYTMIGKGSGLPEGVIYVTGGGNLNFNYQPGDPGRYYGYSSERIGFYNKNDKKYRLGAWIKEYILGDASKNYNVSYTNATIDQINNGTYSLDNYDLIYISGRAEEYVAVNGDLSEDLVKQLYNASAINHKAVMMDYALYDAEKGQKNINNLALLLWQTDQKAIVEGNESFFGYDADGELTGIDNIAGLLRNTAIMNGLQSTILKGYNGNFAVNNVYVYNHHWSDFMSSKLERFQNDALDVFANGDLNSPYTAAATAGGFQSVLAYISYNNTLPNNDTNGTMVEGYVTPAIAIQYILCYTGEDLSLNKGKFVVLEIEPTRQFRFNSKMQTQDYTLEEAEVKTARDEFIRKCLGSDVVENGKQDYVTFVSVTIDQYNTMQTDLIHDYDIIYIGDEFTKYFYTADNINTRVLNQASGFDEVTGTVTKFNDTGMYGNVYYNYGDAASDTQKTIAQRYASRDLTKAKLTELKNYLRARGLIVVDEDLMISPQAGNTIINPTASTENTKNPRDYGRIDDSSNMYELFNFATGRTFDGTKAQGDRYPAGGEDENGNPAGTYSNFVSMGDLGRVVDREDLLIYLNRERVTLNLLSQPTAYVYSPGTSPSFIQVDNKDGKYYLECEFVIENSTAVYAEDNIYQVRFYQDMNTDGRFSETEEKPDFQISRSADGAVVSQVVGGDGVTQYNLNNGVAYKLRRMIPSEEGGVINWCIKAEKVADRNINCTASGFTAVRPREVKYLNILQITPDSSSTINLETILDGENSELYRLLTDDVVAQNYVINVRTITASAFQTDVAAFYGANHVNDADDSDIIYQRYFSSFERTNKNTYGDTAVEKDKDKPMNVNMIILGFSGTEPRFTNNYPIDALRSFMDSNRPVLVGSDVVSADYMNADRGYSYNLLPYLGQDRYGYNNAMYSSFNSNNGVAFRAEGDSTGEENLTDEKKAKNAAIVSTYIIPRETDGGQAVAYIPGGERGNAYIIPYAYTNAVFANRNTDTEKTNCSFINTEAVNSLVTSGDAWSTMYTSYVERVNDGQVSHYPYTIADGGNGIEVRKSHGQYFQLDLDRDSDRDGNSDIVVWYTLGDDDAKGEGVYSSTPRDGINNYYIYNYGNVTFTGFGISYENQCTTEEKKLFVNTLIAAYEAGLVNPTVSYYETPDYNAPMLDSIAVPYDKNVTVNNAIDSSIQMNESGTDYLYKFVNPNVDPASIPSGTRAYFKVQDTNLVKGDKTCKVEFFLGVKESDIKTIKSNNAPDRVVYQWPDGAVSDIMYIQLSDNTVASVVRIPIVIHTADFRTSVGTSDGNAETNPSLEVGTMYGFYVPMSYLNDKGSAEIYIRADTGYKVLSSSTGQYVERPLGTAYDMFTIIKQDLLKLD